MQNDLKLYAASMGKVFRVTHIATSVDEANTYCEKHPDSGVIAEDTQKGIIFVAHRYSTKLSSKVLEDADD